MTLKLFMIFQLLDMELKMELNSGKSEIHGDNIGVKMDFSELSKESII